MQLSPFFYFFLLLGPNIILSTFFSYTLKLRSYVVWETMFYTYIE
jgi:hypothetical protein